MVKYRHMLRLVEGKIDRGHFQDVATLEYEDSLPSAPTLGLVVQLSDLVDFKIAEVRYLPSEKIYETFSHIDFLELEDRFNDYVPRADYAARFVKYGFSVLHDSDEVTAEQINEAVAHAKE